MDFHDGGVDAAGVRPIAFSPDRLALLASIGRISAVPIAVAFSPQGRRQPKQHCPGTAKRRIKEVVIKSTASAASLDARTTARHADAERALPCKSQGGCASSRLDHGFLNSSFGSAGTVQQQRGLESMAALAADLNMALK